MAQVTQPASQTMTDDFKWYASRDDEDYEIGPCSTREEVVELAMDADLGLRQGPDGNWDQLTFYILEGMQDPIDLSKHLPVDVIIEGLCESVDEEHGWEDQYPSENAWTVEQENDLRARMRQVVADWQAQHGIVVRPSIFTHIRTKERVDLTVPLPAI